MSASSPALVSLTRSKPAAPAASAPPKSAAAGPAPAQQVDTHQVDTHQVDTWMLGGIVIAFAALAAGIAATKAPAGYFLQPSSALIVLGGTLGATVVTTPRRQLRAAAQRVAGLWRESGTGHELLIQEILSYVRLARTKGMLALEPAVSSSRHEFLRESLAFAVDAQRPELQAAMENQLRMRERRGEACAATLEAAGGFAPTIGVLGTVVGLIDALRRFSDLSSVAGAVGVAFASTLYGLGLANLLLLPLANRIRAAAAAEFESGEIILEGVACILDGVHPALAAERLKAFVDPQS